MGRQKPTARAEFVLFDVVYEDGTVTSNRKVPGSVVSGLDGVARASRSKHRTGRSQRDQAAVARASRP
jgi:hypothetical protein